MSIPSIYSYIDYRQFLVDALAEMKRRDPSFSMRRFARLAGLSSPNFLQLVRARKLNIGPHNVRKLCAGLNFQKDERHYFEALVGFDHAKTHAVKDEYLRSLLRLRRYPSTGILDENEYAFFSHWYIPVVRELVVHPDYPGDPSWIGKAIIPSVGSSKVKDAIDHLAALGMIRFDEKTAKWRMVQKSISTPSQVVSVALMRYHTDMIGLARDCLKRFPSSQRDIRSVTLGMSVEAYQEVQKRMEAFWRELLDFAGTQASVDRVVQVNMQMFPLSCTLGRHKR